MYCLYTTVYVLSVYSCLWTVCILLSVYCVYTTVHVLSVYYCLCTVCILLSMYCVYTTVYVLSVYYCLCTVCILRLHWCLCFFKVLVTPLVARCQAHPGWIGYWFLSPTGVLTMCCDYSYILYHIFFCNARPNTFVRIMI
jgi:hypothetical protein